MKSSYATGPMQDPVMFFNLLSIAECLNRPLLNYYTKEKNNLFKISKNFFLVGNKGEKIDIPLLLSMRKCNGRLK